MKAIVESFHQFWLLVLDVWQKGLLENSLGRVLVFIGTATVLEIWGIRIGPIIAGLGLFGVAVVLGAQDLFKNLIESDAFDTTPAVSTFVRIDRFSDSSIDIMIY